MKRVKVLAVLLCTLLVMTSVPMMQTLANQSYAETQLFGTANKVVEYAGEEIGTGATQVYSGNTDAKRTGDVAVDEDGNYAFSSALVTSLSADTNGKKFYAGNARRYGSTPTPIVDSGNGKTYDYVSPNGYFWQSLKAPGKVGEAVVFTVSLDNVYSALEFDFINNDAFMDITMVADGFILNGVSAKASYTFEAATLYDVAVRKENAGYGIYVRKTTDTHYTLVTTYTADYSGSDGIYLGVAFPTGNIVNATDVYNNGGTYQWVADGTAGTGALELDNIKAYLTASGVCLNKLAVYEKPLVITDILGENATKLNEVVFNEDMSAISGGVVSGSVFKKRYSGTIEAETGLGVFLSKGAYIGFPWALKGTTADNYDGALADGMALELTFTLPEEVTDSTADKTLILRAVPVDKNKRILFYITNNGNYSFETLTYTNESGGGEKTVLLVWDEDTETVAVYHKNADGTYKFLGSAIPRVASSTANDPDRGIEASVQGFVNLKATTDDGCGIKINKITRYGAGVLDSAALPDGASDMVPYVEEEFEDLEKTNYEANVSGEKGGSVEAENSMLKLNNPSFDEATYAECYADFLAKDISIPKGGYAELKFKMNGSLIFDIMDKESFFTITLKAKANETTYETIDDTETVSNNMSFEPFNWYEMRILRDANGGYTAYTKQCGESNWTQLFSKATPEEYGTEVGIKIRAAAFDDPYTSVKDQVIHSIDYLKVYGAADQNLLIFDGATTLLAQDDTALKYGERIVVKKSENKRTLIFVAYAGNQIVSLIPQTIAAGNDWSGSVPEIVKVDGADTVKIFLWDTMNDMTPKAPKRSLKLTVGK